MQTSRRKTNANRVTNVEYAFVIPLVFQEDDGMGCFCREALRPLVNACPSKGNTNARTPIITWIRKLNTLMAWIRRNIYVLPMQSIVCIRGSPN